MALGTTVVLCSHHHLQLRNVLLFPSQTVPLAAAAPVPAPLPPPSGRHLWGRPGWGHTASSCWLVPLWHVLGAICPAVCQVPSFVRLRLSPSLRSSSEMQVLSAQVLLGEWQTAPEDAGNTQLRPPPGTLQTKLARQPPGTLASTSPAPHTHVHLRLPQQSLHRDARTTAGKAPREGRGREVGEAASPLLWLRSSWA